MADHRDSDRWVTPWVVIAGMDCLTGLVALALAAVTYLSARGVDPNPTLKLVGQLGSGAAGVVSLFLQLANRKTVTKVERNTGLIPTRDEIADAVVDRVAAMPPLDPPAPELQGPPPLPYYDDDTAVPSPRASVPPIPAYPQHTRRS